MILPLLLFHKTGQVPNELLSWIGIRLALTIPHENLLLVPSTPISIASNTPIPSNDCHLRIPLANKGKATPPAHARGISLLMRNPGTLAADSQREGSKLIDEKALRTSTHSIVIAKRLHRHTVIPSLNWSLQTHSS
jgi:hypothetical protein